MSDPRKPNGDDPTEDADDGDRQGTGPRRSADDGRPDDGTGEESDREADAERGAEESTETGSTEPPGDDAGEESGEETPPASSDRPEEREAEGGEATVDGDHRTADGATGDGDADRRSGEDGEAGPAAEAEVQAPEAEGSGGSGAPGGAAAGGGRRRRPHWGWYLLVLLVLVAIVGGALGGRWIIQRFERLEARLADVRTAREEALAPLARRNEVNEAISAAREELQGRLETLASERGEATDELRKNLEARIADVEEAIATVRELAGRRQLEWRLAEVDYLLAVAARRLAIANDRRSAIAALEAADRSLAAIGDVRLVDLRRAIVDDISALRETQPADVEGIALRVQALLERLPDLPEAGAGAPSRAEAAKAESGSAATWWEQLRERLSRYVVVRRKGTPGAEPERIEATLPDREKLRLALSEARRAALRHAPDPYAAAIERARALLDRGFEAGAPVTERFASTLADLAERPVTTQYPDVTETLEQARRVAARLRAEAERIERTRSADPDASANDTGADAPAEASGTGSASKGDQAGDEDATEATPGAEGEDAAGDGTGG